MLRYESALGQSGNLEIDLNFMFRIPLWDIAAQDSRVVGSYQARGIPVLDLHELAAGKLAALFARRASRDLFDAHLDRLLDHGDIVPLLLSDDAAWAERIKQHPLLEWKALSVRQRQSR